MHPPHLCPGQKTLGGPDCPLLPVLNQPSQVKACLVSSGLSQYSRNTDGPLTKSSPSFSLNPGVTCSIGESTHLSGWGLHLPSS